MERNRLSRREISEVKKVRLSGAAIVSFALLAGFAIQILPAQTALTMADPEALAKYINNKSEMERNIMLATPESLELAREGLVQSKVISDDDKNALLDIMRGISAILYPSPAPPPSLAKNAPAEAQWQRSGLRLLPGSIPQEHKPPLFRLPYPACRGFSGKDFFRPQRLGGGLPFGDSAGSGYFQNR